MRLVNSNDIVGDYDLSDIKEDITNRFCEISKRLYLSALAITQNHHTAEDCMQEAYIKIIKKYKQVRDPSKIDCWMTRIVINECKESYRHNKYVFIEDEIIDSQVLEFNDHDLEFFDYISKLNFHERRIVSLKYLSGYTLEEISSIINKPLSTVKSQLYRSLKKLRLEWSNQDGRV